MITVFGAFYFADLQIVREIGVGLALAIFIDAVIVRTIIVPTSMKLLGRLNWWFPKFRQGQIRQGQKQDQLLGTPPE